MNEFQTVRDATVQLKDERDAENEIATAVSEFEQALTDAERALEQVEPSTSAIELFKEGPLRAAARKLAIVDDIHTSIITPKIEKISRTKDALKERLEEITKLADQQLVNAVQQEELEDHIQKQLNSLERESDALVSKYANQQELPEAVDDCNRLELLFERLPPIGAESERVTDRQHQDSFARQIENVKSSLKSISVPLEKDVSKEQELLRELRSTLSELTSIGDEVVAIDITTQPPQQLDSVLHQGENLRQLKAKVEKLEQKLQTPEGMVKRSPVTDDLSSRVMQLQNALEQKKQALTDRAKLQSLVPQVTLITENVQRCLNGIEQTPLQTLEDQNMALQDLEAMKHPLESLLESIPKGEEGDELRQSSSFWLSKLNDLLRKLAETVGDKLAALAAFNAAKDDVLTQLSNIDTPIRVRLDDDSVKNISDRLNELNVRIHLFYL